MRYHRFMKLSWCNRYEPLVSGCIATFVAICILTRVRTNYANGKDERPCVYVHYSLNLLL